MKNKIQNTLGDKKLLKLPKTAFLCSRKIPATAVLKSYDWALKQREAGHCVISGFHSIIEKDVLHYLLKGSQPIIIALARGIKKRLEPELRKPLEEGRLLIISPFDESISRVTSDTAQIRNKLMLQLADKIVIGHASSGGQLEDLLGSYRGKKKVQYLVKNK
jgi:predicted Rossmann fold nucleotide-binding protein DprA/Smf involved in DNA uptake